MSAVFFFLVYGILGWGIDSGYRSLSEHRWTSRNAFKPLPICPIYGFGALMVLGMESSLAPLVAWPFRGLFYGVVLALFEATSGVLTQRVTGKRLWNYGHTRGFFRGYTDFWHVPVWGALALMLVYWVHPFIVLLLQT